MVDDRSRREQYQTSNNPTAGDRSDGWRSQAQLIKIKSLLPSDSPRSRGTDPEHVKRLAEIETGLPPIIVRKDTLQVIDGAHRIEAAKLQGCEEILAVFFEGTDAEALVLSIEANTRHGLPLSLTDRKKAAQRLLTLMPNLSDRAIAAKAGLSAGSVRSLRQRSTAQNEQSTVRVGKDGRARPANSAEARERITGMLLAHPEASTEQLAKDACVSVRMVRGIRRELEGKASVEATQVEASMAQANTATDSSQVERSGRPRRDSQTGRPTVPKSVKVDEITARLLADRRIQVAPGGRNFVEWLRRHALKPNEVSSDLDWLPAEYRADLALIARQSAEEWESLARRLLRCFTLFAVGL